MGYVKSTLGPGEEYLYRARFNWTYDFNSWLWFALCCSPAAVLLVPEFVAGRTPSEINRTGLYFAGTLLAIASSYVAWRYVHRWTTVIAITTVRLILKTGLLSRNTHEVTLDKIEEVLMHQSIPGRIFGYGNLTIRGTGIAVIEFPVLDNPTEIRRQIEIAVVGARGLNSMAHKGMPHDDAVTATDQPHSEHGKTEFDLKQKLSSHLTSF